MNLSKFFIITAIAAVLLNALIIFLLDQEKKSFKKMVGETVIVGKDTSVIVDYNTAFETFTLSNGKTISKEFAKKSIKQLP